MQKLNFDFIVLELSKTSSVFDYDFESHCIVIVSKISTNIFQITLSVFEHFFAFRNN